MMIANARRPGSNEFEADRRASVIDQRSQSLPERGPVGEGPADGGGERGGFALDGAPEDLVELGGQKGSLLISGVS